MLKYDELLSGARQFPRQEKLALLEELIHSLREEEPETISLQSKADTKSQREPKSNIAPKYQPLYEFLVEKRFLQDKLWLSFTEVEELIKDDLPKSAKEYRAWWANVRSPGTQTLAWLEAGWQVSKVDFKGRKVLFSRVSELDTPETEQLGWPPGYFKQTYGSFRDEPL